MTCSVDRAVSLRQLRYLTSVNQTPATILNSTLGCDISFHLCLGVVRFPTWCRRDGVASSGRRCILTLSDTQGWCRDVTARWACCVVSNVWSCQFAEICTKCSVLATCCVRLSQRNYQLCRIVLRHLHPSSVILSSLPTFFILHHSKLSSRIS